MLLTYEEFTKLPMQYVLGINRDDYCARKYWNEQFNINKEVVTERVQAGNIYSGFKDPLVSFYRGNYGDIHKSARELYEAEFLTGWFGTLLQPVRDGWYETEQGMVMFTSAGGWESEEIPEMWRGMRDVTVKAKEVK